MSVSSKNSGRLSLAMERTGQWVLSQDFPADVVVEVGEVNFSLHKFMLVSKSGYLRKLIMESDQPDLPRISIPDVPGGPQIFEKVAKFCYNVNFEINVHNVAPLHCAGEYLEMSDKYCESNLLNRTEGFLSCVALSGLSSAVAVLKSCETLLPMAEDLKIVQRCVDAVSMKACNEANFPTRSSSDWWMDELSILDVPFFKKVLSSMKLRGAKLKTLVSVLIAYTEKSLSDFVLDDPSNGKTYMDHANAEVRKQQKQTLESIVMILPSEKSAFPTNFLCSLLRAAIYLNATLACKNELERRISLALENVSVGDLLLLSFKNGDRQYDFDSLRRIISAFVERERSSGVFNGSDLYDKGSWSLAMQNVAKISDAYLGEIAADGDLSIPKFTGIANLVPKGARKVDDDLYRAVDIYLKSHPGLDEIEREKVCSAMDPLKLSHEARSHASQNKRLPVQIVLHALYYDQLKLRSSTNDVSKSPDAATMRSQIQADTSLIQENEALRAELTHMKMYITDLQKSQGSGGRAPKRNTFFSSVSKTLGKLNPFKHGSKDTSHIDEDYLAVSKPRRRRFSIS